MILRELLSKLKEGYSLVSPILVNVCDEGSLLNSTTEVTSAKSASRARTDDYTREYANEDIIFVGENSLQKHMDKSVTIGRSRQCDVRVRNESVSKNHAFIALDRELGCYCVTDTGSRNGTYINGEVVAPNKKNSLWSGAYLSFGDAVFVFIDPPTLRKIARQPGS